MLGCDFFTLLGVKEVCQALARMWLASTPCARRPPIKLAAMLPAPMKAIRVLLMKDPC
jgi:hypothetical protein